MKKKILLTLFLCAVALGAAFFLFGNKTAEYVEDVSDADVRWASDLLSDSLQNPELIYSQYLNRTSLENGLGEMSVSPDSGQESTIHYKESMSYSVNVEQKGHYYMMLDYTPGEDALSSFNVEVLINGEQAYFEMKNIILPLWWENERDEFPLDSYGDETAPKQVRIEGKRSSYLYSNTYASALPLLFPLEKGINKIEIINIGTGGLELNTLTVSQPDFQIPTYEEYIASQKGGPIFKQISINAVNYKEKNTIQAIYSAENNPALTPHDAKYKKLNTLSWKDAGTTVTYEFTVDREGYYPISFHYKNQKQEFNAFETIMIDGEIPFTECISYAFAPTSVNWTNHTLSDENGSSYYFYLGEGVHTITLKAENEPVDESYHYARMIAEHAAQFSLEITKVTGSSKGMGSTKDKYRTWKMTKYIPEIPDYLKAYKILIQRIRHDLQDYTPYGINGALLSDFDKAEVFIDRMAKYPDEIALYTEDLTGRDNSILVAISNFTSQITAQSFALDMIYLGEEDLPPAKASLPAVMGNWATTLFSSFTSEKYTTKVEDEEVLTIWVNRALTHVDLLQKMVDTEFTPATGIKVKISAMPDANKLTLSAAADQTPDLALGLSSHMPFDLASRGALYDMTQFEDFWKVAGQSVAGAYVPYLYNGGVYAMPETLDFYCMIYRTDIFRSLELEVPDTWDDVISMLPELQRYGMNFYHNISSGVGYKWFYQTTPLIFQNGGKLYTDNGMETALDGPDSVKGLQRLGDLFIAYSLDPQVNQFFNSFRYSVLPVGILASQDYILMKNGAPEMEGQWALAPYPGTVQEDGSIDRWYIANGTGGVIFKDSQKIKESWDFLKWWTSHEVQVSYTYMLQSTYGNEFFWIPSNVKALQDAPIDQADKEIILDMVYWIKDVPRTPGQYILERSISDIWNAMVFDGTSAQVAVDEKAIDINREIKKKMIELGFADAQGNQIKPYTVYDIEWVQEQMDLAGKEQDKNE